MTTDNRPESFYSEIVALLREGKPFALGTVVHTSGSTPQKAGARAIFLPDGRVLGTLGGGCMEAEARRRALEMVRDFRSTTETRRDGDTRRMMASGAALRAAANRERPRKRVPRN